MSPRSGSAETLKDERNCELEEVTKELTEILEITQSREAKGNVQKISSLRPLIG